MDLSNSECIWLQIFIVIFDDFPHYLWMFPLRQKSEVYGHLASVRAYVATQFSSSLQATQCDNGREFDNRMLHTLVSSHVIHFHFACPYISQQNGKTECIICTVNDIVPTHLFQACMPPNFWVEAFHTATYVLNCLPTKTHSLPSLYIGPFNEPWTYDNLCIFGCLCYPNTAFTIPHKLAPCSVACIFLGFSAHHRG